MLRADRPDRAAVLQLPWTHIRAGAGTALTRWCFDSLFQALDRACSFLTLANIGLQMIAMAWALALQLRPLDKALVFLNSQPVERARLVLASSMQSFVSVASSAYGKLPIGSKRQAGSGGMIVLQCMLPAARRPLQPEPPSSNSAARQRRRTAACPTAHKLWPLARRKRQAGGAVKPGSKQPARAC